LGGNPFVCDCRMGWLRQINDISLNGNHARVADLADVECLLLNGDGTAVATPAPLSPVGPEEFLCEYRTHCFATCMCCEFYACDCRMQCPEGCSCYHDSAWSSNIIQCGKRSHNDVPLLIPMDATDIRLDGNNMSDVDSQSFIGRRRVTTLHLNNSRITSLSRQTLSGLTSLEVLHLEDNLLKELHGHEFAALSALRELFLQNNDLIRIAGGTFDALVSLSVLRLDGNLLTTFPAWKLPVSSPLLSSVSLAGNVWSCECDFLVPFRQFLLAHSRRVVDASAVSCMADNLAEVPIVRGQSGGRNVTADCGDNGGSGALVEHNGTMSMVPVLVSCALAVVIVIFLLVAACVFRGRIRRWLRGKSADIYADGSRYGGASSIGGGSTSLYGQNRLFDVYVSYSTKDAEFVDHTLAPALEGAAAAEAGNVAGASSTSYKLCLHQRDFPPSASLYDTVAVAVESSARVVLVLTRAYLEAEWPHVRIPLRNALGGTGSGNRVDGGGKLILLFLEDLSDADLSRHPELRQFARSCATVRWGSPGFLSKLRFFLPEPAFLTFQRSVTLRTLQPTLLKSVGAPIQVDQVSGVWAYTLRDHGDPSGVGRYGPVVSSMPSGGQRLPPSTLVPPSRDAPSVVSSVYSHHTYQSIPESQQQQQQMAMHHASPAHIYHTLEPGLAAAVGQHQGFRTSRRSAFQPVTGSNAYINRNAGLAAKIAAEEDSDDVKESTRTSSSSSPTKSDLKDISAEGEAMDEEEAGESGISSESGSSAAAKEKRHHRSQASTLSAQRLLPQSSSSSSSSSSPRARNDEYIV